VVTFCYSNIYSQKCKVSNDPFSNERIVSFDFNNKVVYYEIKNEVVKFEIIFNYWGERNYIFEDNKDFLFKLKNGKTIVLKSTNESHPKVEQISTTSQGPFPTIGGFSSSESFTAYSFIFNLTKDEVIEFSNSDVTIIRIPETGSDEFSDLEAKGRTKRKTKAIKKGAKCILSYIDN